MLKMRLHEEPFGLIKSGKKQIEVRLLDEKRKGVKIGDDIDFVSRDTGEVINTKVTHLYNSNNFENLFTQFDVLRAGYENKEDLLNILSEFYPISEQEELGVVGIEFETI